MTIRDNSGKDYLDMSGGAAVSCLGHSHPAVVASVTKQLQTLRPEVREALALKVLDGLSYRQISEVTGHSVGKVGTLIHEGLSRLASGLKSAGVV